VGYTGLVRQGGPTDVRELPSASIRKISVSEMDNAVYLLTCRATGEQLLIDAADDAPRILALAGEGASVQPRGTGEPVDLLHTIVTTHQHWDHHRALRQVARETGARTAAGELDADALPVAPDVRLRHGDRLRFGEVELDVIHLRGHTPGSVALAYRDPGAAVHLWTGDSLFPGGVGNTHQDPELFRQLLDDVEGRVFDVYGDDTWVYPGHGGDTTLGAERPQLAQWRSRGW
jgi:glyoxylase-like metal-dependent hydrolase (beta-lactamase superfamily II)